MTYLRNRFNNWKGVQRKQSSEHPAHFPNRRRQATIKKGESGATGSRLSIRNRSRRSAMATSGNPLSPSATKPFNFSDDSVPKRVVLSPDQQRYCLDALKVFKDKRFSSPEKIRQEFMTLQVLLHFTIFF